CCVMPCLVINGSVYARVKRTKKCKGVCEKDVNYLLLDDLLLGDIGLDLALLDPQINLGPLLRTLSLNNTASLLLNQDMLLLGLAVLERQTLSSSVHR